MVAKLAVPVASSGPVPSSAVPSRNVTTPVGAAVAAPDTFAVNTRFAPATAGFALAPSTMLEDCTINWLIPGEVESAWFVSPEYIAVSVCVPAVSVLVLNTAAPFTTGDEPITDAPSRKLTEPPMLGLLLVTVTVSVTLCPSVCGFLLLCNVVVVAPCSTSTMSLFESAAELFPSPV